MHVIIINHHVRMLKLKHNAHMHSIITKNQQSKVRSPHRVQSLNSSRPQQSLFRRAPIATTRRPRYGRHGAPAVAETGWRASSECPATGADPSGLN